MVKYIIILLSIFGGQNLLAQKIKTGVLVVGSTPAALAAAIQSANSGVKTLLMDAGKLESITFSEYDKFADVGIYAGFLKHADSLQKGVTKNNVHVFTPSFTASVFKAWTDTVKNLTVLRNASIKKLKKSGRDWEIDLPGREIKADLIIDGTSNNDIARLAGLSSKALSESSAVKSVYSDKKYRTSVGVLSKGGSAFASIPVSSLLAQGIENLVLAGPVGGISSLHSGQGAGTIAAYCVFFKTSTKNLNIRAIQSELLTYKSRLLKFEDINESDSSMVALQHIGVTGILKVSEVNGRLYFNPDKTISTEDLKVPFREYYSRSQIWFLDNKAEKLNLETTLSLIKFVGSRADELDKEVNKSWNKSLKLKGDFDLKRVLTRREIAILFDAYLQPFSVAVDLEGNIKR
ncbi:MAG TPA: FAD-dependent oxidoreductase [Pedobacter sp.]|jgi:hypothetical protein